VPHKKQKDPANLVGSFFNCRYCLPLITLAVVVVL